MCIKESDELVCYLASLSGRYDPIDDVRCDGELEFNAKRISDFTGIR
jgi:hypothetical protein